MAVTAVSSHSGLRLSYFRLNTTDARLLANFYEEALGFHRVSLERLSGARMEEISPVGGRALRITLALGEQRIQLLQFIDQPGRPYPAGTQSSDLVFQHFAIVVADMDKAMRRLSVIAGWTPISRQGPQSLPKSSGAVTAFKFRDPEGHPLELLAFPPHHVPSQWRREDTASPFLGVDHSAISVSSTERSAAFYESLGLTVSHRSINKDPAQGRLDGLDHALVHVTAMSANPLPPHLELLCYHKDENRTPLHVAANDVAATCMVFERRTPARRTVIESPRAQSRVDPDGHYLLIVDAPR